MNVTLYTKPGCPYCAAAKKYYGDQGVPYTEYDVKSDPQRAAEAVKFADGERIVPVIVENGSVKLGFGGG